MVLSPEVNAARGRHQFEFLKSRGLLPSDTFLDIGCGPGYEFRLARLVIDYLEEGNYIGIDKDEAHGPLVRHEKRPTFIRSAEYHFPRFRQIDFAWAHSLFTHVDQASIRLCLGNLRPLLAGPFYATFNHGRVDKLGPKNEKSNSYRSARYTLDTMQRLGSASGFSVRHIGQWGHWHGQEMLLFETVDW